MGKGAAGSDVWKDEAGTTGGQEEEGGKKNYQNNGTVDLDTRAKRDGKSEVYLRT